jgi:cob(I)alamin adenosyltransferase
MTIADEEQRYREQMQRKKALIDARIAEANGDKGLLLVLTGNGKGKSSSAFGMLARTLGHGFKAGVCQFIKGRNDTGEEAFFRDQPGVDWRVMGEGFTWDTQDRSRDAAKAQAGWEQARCFLHDPELHLVILDELTYCLSYGYLDTATVLADLAARPPGQHVVITGRAASEALIAAADTVTEMRDSKHAYRAGIKAQVGIDL